MISPLDSKIPRKHWLSQEEFITHLCLPITNELANFIIPSLGRLIAQYALEGEDALRFKSVDRLQRSVGTQILNVF